MKIAERLQGKKFNVNEHVFFDVRPFLQKFNECRDTVFVLDEVSIAYSNREWYSVQNRVFRTLMTTQGYRRNILILTLPTLSHLDKSAVDLSHLLLLGVDTGVFRCYRLKQNQLSRKMYPMGFEMLRFDLPTKKSLDDYEKMKDEWNKIKLADDINFMGEIENQENYLKKFSLNDYIQGFKLGMMDFETAKKKIMAMGYGASDVDMVLKMTQQKAEAMAERNRDVEETPKDVFGG